MAIPRHMAGILAAAILWCAGLPAVPSAWALGSGTVEVRVAQASDDAVEDATGVVTTAVDDLRLGSGTGGVRFAGVAIPPGAVITNAYIQFTADQVSNATTVLTIRAQSYNGNPADPASFAEQANDITSRPVTTGAVSWSVPQWGIGGETGVAQQTPDLRAIVQEVVGDPHWEEGDPIVFTITGSGERVARAFRHSPQSAPLLHVEYAEHVLEVPVAAGDEDAEEAVSGSVDLLDTALDFFQSDGRVVGLRFTGITIPQGAWVTRAYIELAADRPAASHTEIVIHAQKDSDAGYFSTAPNDLSSRPKTNAQVTWDPVPAWSTGQRYRTPDLSALLQEIIGGPGWSSGNAVALLMTPGRGWRSASSFNADPAKAPVLHIEYTTTTVPHIMLDTSSIGASVFQGKNPAPAAFKITNSGSAPMSYSLSENAEWLSLSAANGLLAPTYTDTITLTYDCTNLDVGTHTATIMVEAPGAPNSPREVQVKVTVLDTDPGFTCGHVPLYAENVMSPAMLILLDVSGSMDSKVWVNAAVPNPKTPDLSAVVQEIVDRPGWSAGNAMVFLITGSGTRMGTSFDEKSALAPLLHIDYLDPYGTAKVMEARVSQGADDAEEKLTNGDVSTSSDILELGQKGSTPQMVGLRFQGLDILPGSQITAAHIEFVADRASTGPAGLTIWGQDMDNPPAFARISRDLSSRPKTTASVAWPADGWDANIKREKIEIAKDTIRDLIQDKSISWGFGSWCWDDEDPNRPWQQAIDYTIVHEGVKPYSPEHQAALEAAVDALEIINDPETPFASSILAARKYFNREKPENDHLATPGELFSAEECQPRFLIDITDGIGDGFLGSTEASVELYTNLLADLEVTPVGVGFDLPGEDTGQLDVMARVANERGKASDTDDLFALHDEDQNGVARPFLANNQQELVQALRTITERVKGAVFYGSAPAPTTSVDLGDTVILAKFDPSRWRGDVEAVTKDADGLWVERKWRAGEQLPPTRSLWTINPDDPNGREVSPYGHETLNGDNFDCLLPGAKPIGDIVNSAPLVVGRPSSWYPFDGWSDYLLAHLDREPMIYVGANDGALHAFRLRDGKELWAFFPQNLHDKLSLAEFSPLFDRCAPEYCHQYYVDGTPVAEDVYADFDGDTSKEWRTILVVGEREGGNAFFALDVTEGHSFGVETGTAPAFLWQFTDPPELGQSWSEPAVGRIGRRIGSEKVWGVFFGSGYAENASQQPQKEAYLYGIWAHNKAALWQDALANPIQRVQVGGGGATADAVMDPLNPLVAGETVVGQTSGASAEIKALQTAPPDAATLELANISGTFADGETIVGSTTGNHATLVGSPAGDGDALASPLLADLDGDWAAERIYAGNLYGSLARVSGIEAGATPSVSTLFTFGHSRAGINPIRAKAGYVYSRTLGEIWLYFGTGIYEAQNHKTDLTQQYFIGLTDALSPAPTYRPDDLRPLEARFATANVAGVERTFRVIAPADPHDPGSGPWKIALFANQAGWGWPEPVLPAGSERAITEPLGVAGVVFFTTFIPDNDICAGNGDTWVFAVDYETGLAPDFPVWDINGDGRWDEDDKLDTDGDGIADTVPVGIMVGRGKGSHPVLHKDTLFITVTGDGDDGGGSGNDDEQLFAQRVNLPDYKVRVRSWLQR